METIKFKNKDYEIVSKLANKKIHVKRKNKHFIIVPFDSAESFNSYVFNKKALKKNKVEMSKVLKKDKAALLVLEQFIEGENLMAIIASNRLDDVCLKELFRVYRNNRFAQILLSYKPENFVKHKKYFYYVSDAITSMKDGIAFERGDDILLWLNTNKQKQYIINKGYQYLDRMMLTSEAEIKKKIALVCVANW
ncbi:MAG: hypothetical protein MJ213_01195 [Bacilli bacterium]|nr:hypothetical protein [Bacilli bacterium]